MSLQLTHDTLRDFDAIMAKMAEMIDADARIDADDPDVAEQDTDEVVDENDTDDTDDVAEKVSFDIGDMVHFISGDTDGFGIIENIDIDANVYTVRHYAQAGEEFYPTDQVYNLSASDVHPSEAYLTNEQNGSEATQEGDAVEYESEDGMVKAIVQSVADAVLTVEVYAPTSEGYEPTGIVTGVPSADATKCQALPVVKSVHRIVARVKDTIMSEHEQDGRKMGMIEGYASTYGNTDLGGDVVEKGAFTQTLMHNNNRIPLLRDHEYTTDALMGVAYLADDEKGLPFKAMMDLEDPAVASVYGKIKMMAEHGLKMGVSIGYNTIKSEPGENGIRRLKELALHEISITPFPMNTEATITAAKTRKAKYALKADRWSKSVTRRKAVTTPQDATPALVEELKSILKLIQENA